MITEEEKNEIITKAVEKALLMLPKVLSNLMINQANLLSISEEFYKKYPEFSKHKTIVASVIEDIEGKNPNLKYEKILELSVDEIKRRINSFGHLECQTAERPINTSYGDI